MPPNFATIEGTPIGLHGFPLHGFLGWSDI